MNDASTARFYDELASDYHLIFADWDRSMARQGKALHAVIRSTLNVESAKVLDCACGIGTQTIGLALQAHRVTGTDISPVAVERARREAAKRGVNIFVQAADMRFLPFNNAVFDVVVCADNSLPHLLTAQEVRAALGEMRRVLRSGGLLLISTRAYEQIRQARPSSTAPHNHGAGNDRVVTFQLWDWREDGERYDLEHFQLFSDGDDWRVKVRRTAYWALTQSELAGFVAEAGFERPTWLLPEDSAFFQPLLTARVP